MRVNYQTNATPRLQVLSNDQIEQIVYAAMEILQTTGTCVYQDEALELLRNAGCVIKQDNRVYIPSALVENSLRSAPSRVVIAGRNREKRVMLETNSIYYGTGSDCPFILDPYTGERRRYTFEDVYRAAKIAEALPHIDFHMSVGLTSDVPIGTYDRHQFFAMLKGTTKPFVITANDREGLADQYEMACTVIGGVDEWKRLPMFVVYIEPSSPLNNSKEAVEKLLYSAANDIPAIYTPCPIGGATAPATMAGILVQALAEFLTGLVIAQLKKKGAAVIMGGVMSILDMSTTILSYGAPELSLLSAGMTNVAQYLKLPMFSTAGCSDAKTPDQQAAIEAAISIAVSGLSGANLIHDVGYLEYGLSGSYDLLVMSNEIIGMVKRILRGVTVDPDHLALDVIDRVGPGGNYLSEEHTLEYFRTEFWMPELLDRSNWDTWEANGSKPLRQRAHERVLELIETFEPEPIPADIEQKLKIIITRADKMHEGENQVTLV
ncbi:MAG: trimethylamine methyltransferase family protein [Chloroflexi bacterium]|nr:trimethylamine methyltransferase family protein [Chloroflexota bacterium]